MTVSTIASGQRWHELDAVRAFALLLGVALHGAMSFMSPRIWLVDDVSHSTGINVLFYVIHMFRMTTFFVLAGFFARMMLQKRGIGGFVTNRLKRIAIPLVAFWPLIMASIIAVAIVANMPAPGTPAAPPPPPPALSVATFPLTHLWFLYALLLLYTGAIVVKVITDVLHVGGVLDRLLDSVVRALTRTDMISALLILPVATTFYFNDHWMMWLGVMTPDTGLVPNSMAIAAFTMAFTFGWWLNRSSDLLGHLAGRTWLYGFSAVVGTALCLAMVGPSPVLMPTAGHDHLLYILIYPLTAWSWTLFLIGGAHAVLKRENPVIRYLADASYWIYVVHVPVLLGLQYAVKTIDLPAELKFAGIVIATVLIALGSYAVVVRYTFIGAILNGRRRKAKADPKAKQEVPA